MKKFSAILASLVVLLTVVGCGSTGGGGVGSSGLEPYSVNLSGCKVYTIVQDRLGQPVAGATVRNATPFAKNYDDLFVLLPEIPVDLTKYNRVTIRAKYFNAAGAEVPQGDGKAMCSLIEDPAGNIRGRDPEGVYPNIPIKQYNLGGYSGQLSTSRGARISLSRNPGAVLLQNSDANVRFIELTAVVFHTGNFEQE